MNRDLCGVKLISGLYCRLSAPGRSPAALKGQKAPQFKILPSKCPWTISSGTQRAESSTIQDIAAEVPLDDLQRHSKGRKPHNSRYCRRSALGLPPAALKRHKTDIFQYVDQLLTHYTPGHLKSRKGTGSKTPLFLLRFYYYSCPRFASICRISGFLPDFLAGSG